MGKAKINPLDVRTFWKCIPEPEQATLRLLAEFAATPLQIVSFDTVYQAMIVAGAKPARGRTEALFKYPGMTVVNEGELDCTDPDGCLVLAFCQPVIDTLACIIVFGCHVGAPEAEPCYYARTHP